MHPPSQPSLQLTYCLNINPGESWDEQFRAIREQAVRVRRAVAPAAAFGLGLRLGHDAVLTLARPNALAVFREWMADHGMYVATVNGFPYGRFHGTKVKDRVYAPDWRTVERRDYTVRLAHVLAGLIPAGGTASISTVPVSFRPWIRSTAEAGEAVARLVECAVELAQIEREHHRTIQLALEPEPGCYLERTEEVVTFFNDQLFRAGREEVARAFLSTPAEAEALLRRHVGVCLDTCHAAVLFESPLDALRRLAGEGIGVFKVQLSAALGARNSAAARAALAAFAEPTYLHQTATRGGAFWPDLPDALAELAGGFADEDVRVHFHVPLFWEGDGVLGSTAAELTAPFFDALRSGGPRTLEIETYTFNVLPPDRRPADMSESLIREFRWVLDRFAAKA